MFFIGFGIVFGGLLGAWEAHVGSQNASKKRYIFGMFFGSLWEHLRTAQNPISDIDCRRGETGGAWGRVRVGVNPTLFPTKDFPSKGLAGLE